MAFLIKDTLIKLQTHLVKGGYVKHSMIGEPKAIPAASDDVVAAVYMQSVTVVRIMADGATVESHVVTIRLFRDMLGEPKEDTEILLAEASSKIAENILGEFDLGGTIRNVDAAGANGTPWSIQWGYVDLGGVMFRVADMTVPMVVDGSVTMAA